MWIISYWVFPVISACMWLAMLLVMLITWGIGGEPHYPSMEAGQRIAYISDIGAYGLKPLFIAGSCVTVVFLDLGFISERWLRHTGQLAPNTSLIQKILSFFAIVFAIAGAAGLILLSIFDTYHHPHMHDGFLLLFIAGYVISAIFVCAEYQRLGIHYRNHRILRISFWIKLAFILVEVAFAIVFIATSYTHHRNVAAIFEWIIAFTFTFYVLSFIVDLLPSVRTKKHVPQGVKALEMGQSHKHDRVQGSFDTPGRYSGSTTNGPEYQYQYQQPLTTDSAGPNNASVHMTTTANYPAAPPRHY